MFVYDSVWLCLIVYVCVRLGVLACACVCLCVFTSCLRVYAYGCACVRMFGYILVYA